jgi:hypothetical protein
MSTLKPQDHQDAGYTPLPWAVDVRSALRVRSIADKDLNLTVASTGCSGLVRDQWENNARYIVHACNAYPRLVEVLRYYAIPGMGDNGDKARALLKELGE